MVFSDDEEEIEEEVDLNIQGESIDLSKAAFMSTKSQKIASKERPFGVNEVEGEKRQAIDDEDKSSLDYEARSFRPISAPHAFTSKDFIPAKKTQSSVSHEFVDPRPSTFGQPFYHEPVVRKAPVNKVIDESEGNDMGEVCMRDQQLEKLLHEVNEARDTYEGFSTAAAQAYRAYSRAARDMEK